MSFSSWIRKLTEHQEALAQSFSDGLKPRRVLFRIFNPQAKACG